MGAEAKRRDRRAARKKEENLMLALVSLISHSLPYQVKHQDTSFTLTFLITLIITLHSCSALLTAGLVCTALPAFPAYGLLQSLEQPRDPT